MTRGEQQSPAPFFDFARYGTWSPPVLIDDPTSWRVNTACREQGPALSANGRVLYFASMRVSNDPSDGCKADFDIWVSQRACRSCAWEAPARLDVVNSPENDATAAPSPDGRLLFIGSARPGAGQNDLFVSRRVGGDAFDGDSDGNDEGDRKRDALNWSPPEPVGKEVNTEAFESGGSYLAHGEGKGPVLYFSRGPTGGLQDIYRVPVTRAGKTRGIPAEPVAELNSPLHEAIPTLRVDGRELFFWGRTGGDIWTSTRPRATDPWGAPVNVAEVNSPASERQPNLSPDARTLLFSRLVAAGVEDIWISTRTRSRDD